MGVDGTVTPAPRSREDIMVARVLHGSNLEYAINQMKSYLAVFSFLVKDKNLSLTIATATGERRPVTQKEYAKMMLAYYIDIAHSNNYMVNYYKPGDPPLNMEQIVNRILLEPRIAAIVKEDY